MAGGSIQLSLAAERDLDDLFDHIEAESGGARADAAATRILTLLASLADLPGMGRIRRELDGEPRSFVVWPWIVLYEPLIVRPGIFVLRILDGRRHLTELT